MWPSSGAAGYGWTAIGANDARTWICVGKVRGFSAAIAFRPKGDRLAVALSNRDAAPALEICSDLLGWNATPVR
jgi:hypothetical protein